MESFPQKPTSPTKTLATPVALCARQVNHNHGVPFVNIITNQNIASRHNNGYYWLVYAFGAINSVFIVRQSLIACNGRISGIAFELCVKAVRL